MDDTNKPTPDDKYPWLESYDIRKNMTDSKILRMKLNLKDVIPLNFLQHITPNYIEHSYSHFVENLYIHKTKAFDATTVK